jgi:hypothetical protein
MRASTPKIPSNIMSVIAGGPEGFELAVRLREFAIEIPREFPASRAKIGPGENIALWVLGESLQLSLRGPVWLQLN